MKYEKKETSKRGKIFKGKIHLGQSRLINKRVNFSLSQ